MARQLQVNEKQILQKINFLDSVGPQSWSDYEAYARCLFYLGEAEKAKAYFLEAAKRIVNLIAVFERKNRKEFVRLKLVQANYYRLAGEKRQSVKQYAELRDLYLNMFETDYEGDQDRAIGILNNLSYCHFFLEDYEKSIRFGKMVSEWEPISLGYSEGIFLQDKKRIESTLDDVIKEIKREKSVPYDTGAEVSLWDWYEIGRELLE
ncbi:hypothetical protein [Lihuaxuella thermophila]|uniref:Tetratricopeptide repeat-containing protein n=1 Tax=Lihuaxuella thermophila TaxID=1173111 RepID=A0A1H8EXU6_9BACL|nr:hypothetical protein [Lihuaxuella thermophila]SEN24216.1 hypothetical protein SAMN05444955_107225 [Lihuaxuella thermophila]